MKDKEEKKKPEDRQCKSTVQFNASNMKKLLTIINTYQLTAASQEILLAHFLLTLASQTSFSGLL